MISILWLRDYYFTGSILAWDLMLVFVGRRESWLWKDIIHSRLVVRPL